MSHYMIVEENKITSRMCGPLPESAGPGRSVVECPENLDGSAEDLREYDEDWNLRPLSDRISEGLVEVPVGHKVGGESIVPMTYAEQVETKLLPRPKGAIVDELDGEVILRGATLAEQVRLGDITEAEGDLLQALAIRAERESRLSACDWTQASDQPESMQDLWRPYRQALRDVPDQVGFPWSIKWPVRPDGVEA